VAYIASALKFLLFISLTVIVVEVLQIVFLTGSADIDDFILNVGGAMAAYGVLNIQKVKYGINKFLFGECDET
jgi:glycopeptide antibiotics resistance protein